jgi:hypothetical protein
MDFDIPSHTPPQTTLTAGTTDADTESVKTTDPTAATFNPAFPQPLPFETLKANYDHTAKDWLYFISERSKAAHRKAFVKVEGYWLECREEVKGVEESGVREAVVASVERKEKCR